MDDPDPIVVQCAARLRSAIMQMAARKIGSWENAGGHTWVKTRQTVLDRTVTLEHRNVGYGEQVIEYILTGDGWSLSASGPRNGPPSKVALEGDVEILTRDAVLFRLDTSS